MVTIQRGGISVFKDIKHFIKDFFTKARRKRSIKKLLIIASVFMILALIPTFMAVWNVYFKNNENFVSSQDVSVILVDIINDQELVNDSINEKSLSDSPDIDMLYNINSHKAISAAPSGAPDSPNFKLSVSIGSSATEYLCYFSDSTAQSYLKSSDGAMYSVNSAQYNKFLSSEYSDTAYASATPPALTTDNGATITPSDVKWYFKKANGAFERSYAYSATQTNEAYQISKTVALNFSAIPDICEIKVFEVSKSGELKDQIYSGSLDMLSYITVQDGVHLYFEVKASWNSSADSPAYGEISYKFLIDCKDYATFELSSDSVLPGQYISIVLHDLSQSDEVIYSVNTDKTLADNILANNIVSNKNIFSTDDPISFLKNFTPQFIEVNGSLIGLLPVPHGTPSGTLSFTIACGVTKKTFNVKIGESESNTTTVELDNQPSHVLSATSHSAMNEVNTLLKNTAISSRPALLSSKGFNSVATTDYSRIYSYTDAFSSNAQTLSGVSALGSFYEALNDNANFVCSANSGIVTYTGSAQHLGNVVIVDHGMGLFTWYCNLSDIDVRVGDSVAKGELIGKAGASPLIKKNGVLILCSVYNTFIDPEVILGKEIFN
jgi:hypothetical protein